MIKKLQANTKGEIFLKDVISYFALMPNKVLPLKSENVKDELLTKEEFLNVYSISYIF